MEAVRGLNLSWARALPCELQTEAAECGLACLAMVASYHGHSVDLATLRRRFQVSLKGMSARQLMETAARMKLTARPVRAELAGLGHLNLPAILHWDFNHFVVLKKVTGTHLFIHDPAVGERRLRLSEASQHFTGVAFEMEPALGFQPKKERERISVRRVMGKVRGLKRSLGQIIGLALALEVFALLGPFLTQWVIDDALVSADRDLLFVVVVAMLLLSIVKTTIGAVRTWVVLHMATHLNVQWVAGVLHHLLHLPVTFFEKRHIGDVASRFNATTAIQQTITTGFVSAVIDGLMASTTLLMLCIYNMKLALLAIAAVALYALSRVMRYGALLRASEGQLVRMAKLETHFMETVRAIQPIKLFNREMDRKAQYMKLSVDVANTSIEVQRMNLGFQVVNGLIVGAEGALILWLGSLLVLEGGFSIGMLVAFIAYKDQFTARVCSLVDCVIDMRMLRLQAARLSDIVLTPPERTNPHHNPHVLRGDGPRIELRNVRFRYGDGEPWVLDDVNLVIEPGQAAALVGPSGCGKTTLVKILLGLLQPTEGEVLVDGVPLQKIGTAQYRSASFGVMQKNDLLSGTLADNISFFDSPPDQARIESAARMACLHDVITKMPMGYHTLVGDMGNTLSGGQVQRLLIARALYKQPKLLVLDEGTSNLDVPLEAEVLRNLARLGATRLIVAHRPETIRSCTRVIQLGRMNLEQSRSGSPVVGA